jgi:hypothetical protein
MGLKIEAVVHLDHQHIHPCGRQLRQCLEQFRRLPIILDEQMHAAPDGIGGLPRFQPVRLGA